MEQAILRIEDKRSVDVTKKKCPAKSIYVKKSLTFF